MINNFWEEKNMPDKINSFHEELLSKAKIPKWMNLDCPFCGEKLPLSSIRHFGVKLNTRNMGDIVVEILCTHCKKMDTLYFRKEIEQISDFMGFLSGEKEPINKPIIEEEMYKLQYNNVVEKMLGQGVN